MKYVALLRGINVGGNRKVAMSDLKAAFSELGFTSVSTYINSGNVIFESANKPDATQIQLALRKRFGFDIDTLILSAKEIVAIASAIPDEWTNDAPNPEKSGYKSDVLYLFDDIDTPNILEKICHRPEIENMIYMPRAVLANVSRKNQSRYSLLKLTGTPLYGRMTIRNIATAKKLAELVQ